MFRQRIFIVTSMLLCVAYIQADQVGVKVHVHSVNNKHVLSRDLLPQDASLTSSDGIHGIGWNDKYPVGENSVATDDEAGEHENSGDETHPDDEQSGNEGNNDEGSENKKPDDEESDDNSGDENPGDENPHNENENDENPDDEKTGDEKSNDEKSGDANSDDEESGDGNSGDDASGDENPDDESSGDESSGPKESIGSEPEHINVDWIDDIIFDSKEELSDSSNTKVHSNQNEVVHINNDNSKNSQEYVEEAPVEAAVYKGGTGFNRNNWGPPDKEDVSNNDDNIAHPLSEDDLFSLITEFNNDRLSI